MVTLTIPCPETGLNLTQNPLTGAVSMNVLCSDSNRNGLINGSPTLFYDCGGPNQGTYTLIVDGETFMYDGPFTHRIACDEECGPGIDLPDVINVECGPGVGLPNIINIACGPGVGLPAAIDMS